VRFGAGRKRRDLLVPNVDPFDLALAADGVSQPVDTVAYDAVYTLHSRRGEGFDEVVRNGFHLRTSLLSNLPLWCQVADSGTTRALGRTRPVISN